jgi:hypothetical protein
MTTQHSALSRTTSVKSRGRTVVVTVSNCRGQNAAPKVRKRQGGHDIMASVHNEASDRAGAWAPGGSCPASPLVTMTIAAVHRGRDSRQQGTHPVYSRLHSTQPHTHTRRLCWHRSLLRQWGGKTELEKGATQLQRLKYCCTCSGYSLSLYCHHCLPPPTAQAGLNCLALWSYFKAQAAQLETTSFSWPRSSP